jgi:hypothetical protein
MKVSDILIKAADEHLSVTRTDEHFDGEVSDGGSPYICDAVSAATSFGARGIVIDFLSDLGMDTGYGVFHHVPAARRQAARFDFLNLAILVAEDENIRT